MPLTYHSGGLTNHWCRWDKNSRRSTVCQILRVPIQILDTHIKDIIKADAYSLERRGHSSLVSRLGPGASSLLRPDHDPPTTKKYLESER